MAGGSWTAKHIVHDLPASHREAYAQFYRSPCLMTNIAVRNWPFLYKMGMSGCRWFGGLGDYLSVRKMALVGNEPRTIDGKPAPRDILRNRPHGRIAFANTDLAGASDPRNSIREADRAMKPSGRTVSVVGEP
jgi:hypothetical protein